jgi:hypothetical protein
MVISDADPCLDICRAQSSRNMRKSRSPLSHLPGKISP